MVGIVLVVVAGLVVFAIAAATIGREAHRLDALAPRAVYDPEEALSFIAERLTPSAAARVTPDELRQLLRWHLELLRERHLAPPKAVDQVQDIDEPVVVEGTDVIARLIQATERSGAAIDDDVIAEVVDGHLGYLDAIGAVGPPAADPDVPPPDPDR